MSDCSMTVSFALKTTLLNRTSFGIRSSPFPVNYPWLQVVNHNFLGKPTISAKDLGHGKILRPSSSSKKWEPGRPFSVGIGRVFHVLGQKTKVEVVASGCNVTTHSGTYKK